MKYDFTRCNNLQFKIKDGNDPITGYLKVMKDGSVYIYTDCADNEVYNAGLQQTIRDWETHRESIEECSKWAESVELEIIPRDPETYTDWKVGDKVKHNINDHVSTILAVLGEAIILSKDSGISVTALTTADSLTKRYKLVLTDYEKELLNAQKQEENKKKECPFKEEDKVLVRDKDSSWAFDEFLYYDAESHYPYKCVSSSFEQCIPLNEHTWKLLGTTDEYETIDNNESL